MNNKYSLLLDYFNDNKKEVISAREMAEKLGCSSRSTLRYINIVNSLDDDESFRIISVKNKGFKLQIIDEKKYEEFRQKLMHSDPLLENQNNLIFRLVLENLSTIYLEKELNYSQASISRLISALNEKLATRRLAINRKNNIYILEGNEIQIRNFGQYLWQLNNYEPSKLPNNLSIEYERYCSYLRTNNIDILPELQSYLFISLIRCVNGHTIEFSPILKGIFSQNHTNKEVIRLITNYYYDNYSIKISDDEKIFINLLLNGDEGNNSFSDNVNAIMPVINNMLKDIDYRYGTNFENDDDLLNSFSSHIASNMANYLLTNKPDNALLNQIRLNYTNEHVYALELANSLSKLFDIQISDEDIGYLTLHFANSNEKKKVDTITNATIVYAQSATTANFLQLRLKELFPQLNTVIRKNDETISEKDLIIVYEEDLVDSTNIIINPFVNDEDKKKLESAILEKIGFEPFLEVSSKDEFYIIDKVKSKNEFLDYATKELMKKNIIQEKERDSIIEREKLSSTEIAMGVAFPHCVVNTKSFLSIFILKHPVLWNNSHVQMILIMGYNKNDEGNTNAIKYLFSNLSNKEKVEKLIQTSSYEDFIKELKGDKNVK